MHPRPVFAPLLLGCLVAAIACAGERPTQPVRRGTVRVTGESVFVGRSMLASFVPPDSSSRHAGGVRWSSSDTSVLVVDSTGLVAAVGPGTAAVLAEWQGIVGERRVRSVPRYADRGVRFTRLSRGLDRNCAIAADGAVHCMRVPGAADSMPEFDRMPGAAGLRFVEVSTAFSQTVCGLLDDGRIACWGSDDWQVNGAPVTPTGTGPILLSTTRRFRTMGYDCHRRGLHLRSLVAAGGTLLGRPPACGHARGARCAAHRAPACCAGHGSERGRGRHAARAGLPVRAHDAGPHRLLLIRVTAPRSGSSPSVPRCARRRSG